MSKKARIAFVLVVAYIALSLVFTRISDEPFMKFAHSYKSHTQATSETIDLKKVSQDLHKGPKLSANASLREQLAYQFPYEAEKPMPKFIWQTWKVDMNDKKFPKNFKHLVRKWKSLNPKYAHKLLPDSACHEMVESLFQTVPDVLRAYNAMPHPILKADFFRYLIVYARGGVYSDIDTFNLKEIDSWPVPDNVGLVVGIEADPDRPDWADWYARRIQFCQWTIRGKKGHPMLLELIAKITEITLQRLESGKIKLAKGNDEGSDIMNWTGPGIFTDEIFNYLNNVVKFHSKDNAQIIVDNNVKENEPQHGLKDAELNKIEESKKINWKLFSGISTPILVDDVLVLPITSFSPGVGQMGAQDENHELAFVKHMFEGSWKNEKRPPQRNDDFEG